MPSILFMARPVLPFILPSILCASSPVIPSFVIGIPCPPTSTGLSSALFLALLAPTGFLRPLLPGVGIRQLPAKYASLPHSASSSSRSSHRNNETAPLRLPVLTTRRNHTNYQVRDRVSRRKEMELRGRSIIAAAQLRRPPGEEEASIYTIIPQEGKKKQIVPGE
jgi:hypothetical protein